MKKLIELEKNQMILIKKITHMNRMTECEYDSGYFHFLFLMDFFLSFPCQQ